MPCEAAWSPRAQSRLAVYLNPQIATLVMRYFIGTHSHIQLALGGCRSLPVCASKAWPNIASFEARRDFMMSSSSVSLVLAWLLPIVSRIPFPTGLAGLIQIPQ